MVSKHPKNREAPKAGVMLMANRPALIELGPIILPELAPACSWPPIAPENGRQ
jgi:hypothetical protein